MPKNSKPMDELHAAYVTSPTGRRCVLRPVETGRSLERQLSPANREWVLRVDEATGAEYWFSTKTHNTLAEPPLIEDVDSPLPKLLPFVSSGAYRRRLVGHSMDRRSRLGLMSLHRPSF